MGRSPRVIVLTDTHGASTSEVTWSGRINSGNQIAISFDVIAGGSITVGDRITNSFVINYGGALITETVVITASENSVAIGPLYLPMVLRSLPTPVLSVDSPAPSGNTYAWEADWGSVTGATSYIIEESSTSTFDSSTTNTTSGTSFTFSHTASKSNVFYYRVKAANNSSMASSPWSNVVKVIGAYHDNFNSASPEWEIRRQDLDDTNNTVTFPGLSLKLDIDGRWDYALTSPLIEAPKPPYRIETRVKYEGVANLNTYGIVWGGDWNGDACPRAGRSVATFPENMIPATSKIHDILSGNDRAVQGYSDNCFETYYRAMFLWSGPSNVLRTQVKAIFQHDNNNSGQGIELYPWREVAVSSGDNQAYNIWKIDVFEDGKMHLYSGDNFITEMYSTAYFDQPYFGFFASSDEYPGADPLYDYLKITPLP